MAMSKDNELYIANGDILKRSWDSLSEMEIDFIDTLLYNPDASRAELVEELARWWGCSLRLARARAANIISDLKESNIVRSRGQEHEHEDTVTVKSNSNEKAEIVGGRVSIRSRARHSKSVEAR